MNFRVPIKAQIACENPYCCSRWQTNGFRSGSEDSKSTADRSEAESSCDYATVGSNDRLATIWFDETKRLQSLADNTGLYSHKTIVSEFLKRIRVYRTGRIDSCCAWTDKFLVLSVLISLARAEKESVFLTVSVNVARVWKIRQSRTGLKILILTEFAQGRGWAIEITRSQIPRHPLNKWMVSSDPITVTYSQA